jgi:hypothetical protein
MGIDPEGENDVSDIKSRLVTYKLTEKAVNALKDESLDARMKKLLDVFLEESYAGTGRLMLDMGITADFLLLFAIVP